MKIDRNNFEHYYLLHLEGNLSPEDTAGLMLFLSMNPDLDPLNDNMLSVFSNGIHFSGKELLRKDYCDVSEINEFNFDEFCIARMENQLGDEDIMRLEVYIKNHPEKEKDVNLIKRLKLTPDKEIEYRGKSSLKRAVAFNFRKRLIIPAAVAASITFVLLSLPRNVNEPVAPDYATVYVPPAMVAESAGKEQAEVSHETAELVSAIITEINFTDPVMAETEIENESTLTSTEKYLLSGIEPVNLAMTLPVVNINDISTAKENRSDRVFPFNPFLNEDELNFPGLGSVDLWQAAVIAVKGFNMLTESDLFVEKSPDGEDKVRISLGSGEKTYFAASFRDSGL